MFSVIIAMLPLGAAFARLWTDNGELPALEEIIGRGQLMLTIIGATAAGLSQLFSSTSKSKTLKILAGGGSFVVAITACFYYSHVSYKWSLATPPSPQSIAVVMRMSAYLAIGCVICGLICVGLPQEDSKAPMLDNPPPTGPTPPASHGGAA